MEDKQAKPPTTAFSLAPRLNLSEGVDPVQLGEAEAARHARQDARLKRREEKP